MKNLYKVHYIIFFIFILFPLMSMAMVNKLVAVQTIKKNSAVTRLVLTLAESSNPNLFSLSNPNRLVVDFDNTRLGVNVSQIHITGTPIQHIRSGHSKPNRLRMVFELNQSVQVKKNASQKKVIIDLIAGKKTEIKKAASVVLSPQRIPTTIVVIDPGHGGKDPGATGENGTREKDVVLGIAKKLAELINQQSSMRAVLTRDGDYFIPLKERLMLARKGKADLFIAIHADSYFNDHARGASVYILSEHGASSVAARWLANRENHSELDGVDLSGLQDQSYLVRSVLIDLAQTVTAKDSYRWGNMMLDSLNPITGLHFHRVEQAPFLVLKSPDIPSILVETGFISNRKEELRLRDKSYQNKIALALFQAIQQCQKKILLQEYRL